MIFTRLICLLTLNLWINVCQAEDLKIAAASNFSAPLSDIVAEFEKSTGHVVKISFGSSGKIFSQIKYGAPFQVFFSADQTKPSLLIQEGLASPENRMTYAIGALALWSAKAEFLDSHESRLQQVKFNKLALANPKLAPYGAAAIDVLDRLKLTKATKAKWVIGENIAQTYQFVSTGNADMGFVALSQIRQTVRSKQGSAWIIPTELYNPILQDAVILKHAEHNKAAHALMNFVQGEKARHIILSYGYKTPALEH